MMRTANIQILFNQLFAPNAMHFNSLIEPVIATYTDNWKLIEKKWRMCIYIVKTRIKVRIQIWGKWNLNISGWITAFWLTVKVIGGEMFCLLHDENFRTHTKSFPFISSPDQLYGFRLNGIIHYLFLLNKNVMYLLF